MTSQSCKNLPVGYGVSSVSELFVVQTWGLGFDPQSPYRMLNTVVCLITLVLESQNQVGPWALLANQSSLTDEPQASESLYIKETRLTAPKKWHLRLTSGLHMWAHMCLCTHMHEHTEFNWVDGVAEVRSHSRCVNRERIPLPDKAS